MASFDLVDQPWIPCIDLEGKRDLYSLRQTLCDAASLREIADDSPLVTVSLHRLLLAILYRCCGPSSFAEWCDLWQQRAWDRDAVGVYLETYREKGRFDLFDATRPFYGVPRMDDVKDYHPITRLQFERASGNNPAIFDHSMNADANAVSPDVAARHLIAYQAFAVAGGVSQPFNLSDGLLTKGYTVLAIGNNLFETLCLNLIPATRNRPIPTADERIGDRPFWEQDTLIKPEREGTVPLGYADYLTWQSRRIFLEPVGNPPQVRRCQVQQNLKMHYDLATGQPLDPFKSYRKNKEERFVVRNLAPERGVWRDSDVLFQPQIRGGEYHPPLVFNHLIQVYRAAKRISANTVYQFDVYGCALTKGREPIVFWRHERLPLPLRYLEDAGVYLQLQHALKFAESVGSALRAATRVLASTIYAPDPAQKADPKDVKNLLLTLAPGEQYWASLEQPFSRFLVAQADEEEPGEARQAFRIWGQVVERAAREDFQRGIENVGDSARVLRATVAAEKVFNRRLKESKEAAGLLREQGEADEH